MRTMRYDEKNKQNSWSTRRVKEGAESAFREIIAENFPNLEKKLNIQDKKLIEDSIITMKKDLIQNI